jgi:hypothetical protein
MISRPIFRLGIVAAVLWLVFFLALSLATMDDGPTSDMLLYIGLGGAAAIVVLGRMLAWALSPLSARKERSAER